MTKILGIVPDVPLRRRPSPFAFFFPFNSSLGCSVHCQADLACEKGEWTPPPLRLFTPARPPLRAGTLDRCIGSIHARESHLQAYTQLRRGTAFMMSKDLLRNRFPSPLPSYLRLAPPPLGSVGTGACLRRSIATLFAKLLKDSELICHMLELG